MLAKCRKLITLSFVLIAAQVSSKPERSQDMTTLVVQSTIEWAHARIAEQPLQQDGKYVPQTNEYLAKVQPMLWKAFKEAVAPALKPSSFEWPEPAYARMQRWGAALVDEPIAPEGEKVFADDSLHFVACGDFCTGKGVSNALDSAHAAVHKVEQMVGK
jgi:predicted NAD/FAD-dependent oxidoreductase